MIHNPPMADKGTILVMDDDRLVLATLVHGLVQAGYEVIDADNGDDAILLARQHRPDLALLDIRMQGKSGFDVAAYLREYLQVPFMFLSAFADDDTLAQVQALGAVAYLVKPLDIGQIVPTVAAALARLAPRESASTRLAPRESASTRLAPRESASTRLAPRESASTPLPNRDLGNARPAADGAAVPAQPSTPAPGHDLVAIAVGVLMHRYSLARAQAHARLQRLADEAALPLHEQAARLVQAVELLAQASVK